MSSRFIRSLGHALNGLASTARSEANFRFHLGAAAAAVAAAAALRLPPVEWAVLAVCIGLVTGAELFNTALERLADAVSPDPHPGVGLAKDAAAAAVLVTAGSSVTVGAFLFVPKLVALAAAP